MCRDENKALMSVIKATWLCVVPCLVCIMLNFVDIVYFVCTHTRHQLFLIGCSFTLSAHLKAPNNTLHYVDGTFHTRNTDALYVNRQQ